MYRLLILLLLIPMHVSAETYVCSYKRGELAKFTRVDKKFEYFKEGKKQFEYIISDEREQSDLILTALGVGSYYVVIINKYRLDSTKTKAYSNGVISDSGICEVVN